MKDLSFFRSRVTPHVPGCPDMTIDLYVLDAAITFCEKTGILRQTLDPITLTANQFEVSIDPPDQYKVVQTLRVWINDTEIFPATEDATGVFGYTQSLSTVTPNSQAPRTFTESSPGNISVYPRPDALITYQLTPRVSLKPSRAATQLDDDLYENWINGITSGALSGLLMMKTVWGDRPRAEVEAAKFNSAVGDASLEAKRGRTRAEASVKPVWI